MFERSFYFLRHGETDWNIVARLQGFKDIPLNSVGVQQAKGVAGLMAGLEIDTCVVSDMSRAITTAKNAMKYHDAPFFIDKGLRERHFGDWEGQLMSECKHALGIPATDRLPHTIHLTNGEDWDVFCKRVYDCVRSLQKQHEGEILLVAHGFVFVALTELLIGEDAMSQNCVPYRFDKISDAEWQVQNLMI